MDAKDEIIKARVRLQKENPFFSYLVMSLNLVEDKEGKEVPSCAVDMRGNLYYNPKFINKLNQDTLKTLLSHEVLHIALLHLIRAKDIIPEIDIKTGTHDRSFKTQAKLGVWNIATDLVINNTLAQNGFEFSGELDKGLNPRNNEFLFKADNLKIKDIDKKIAEEIYNEIYNKLKKGIDKYKGFDEHIYLVGEDKKGEGEGKEDKKGKGKIKSCGISKEELEKLGKDWKKRLIEAGTYAKLQGKEPRGLSRYIDELLHSKLNWKELLYRYITQEIPVDYDWNFPSKRSQALKIYLPKIKKELIDITIAVDTSGSIGKEELTEFLSEVVGIGRAFESLRINIFFMDTKVHNHYVLNNGNYEEVLNYKIQGGGGTDFTKVYDYIEKEAPNTRLLVFFTDLYADFPKEEEIKTIWVVCKDGKKEPAPFGETIWLN